MNITFIMGEEEKRMEIMGGKIKDLLQEMEIPLETVVVKKNQQIVIEEESLEDGDTIEVIRVIYGG
ncbi:MoaD/ThiS family protein [Methanobacterium sp. CWC-01]|uniref:MoaD/ThiS family protein n=1 Tax=Methanobacterium aridiramus TaxID=2584467 RepID=UPI002574C9D4|nr:MoaD/ThiS family protein [Methanobacterium sp. CWC-01]WJI09898.1 MoaD/ThiS family protein [Methanobacterium sp. CWC-01]